jgi:endoglucanase
MTAAAMRNPEPAGTIRRQPASWLMTAVSWMMIVMAGTSLAATASPAAAAQCAPAGSQLSIRVCGNRLVDAHGNAVQLRGVSVSGLEAVAILGWSPSNPWGSQTGTATPDWAVIKTWGVNVVRLPLNEASWLGLSCVDEGGDGVAFVNGVKVPNKAGTTIKADPGGNYQSTVASSVAGATAAGLYVILDLHLAAPGNVCPNVQNAMADADHSIAFWTSVATSFKGSPNVIFELFNEPFLDMTSALQDKTPWQDLRDGGATLSSYLAQTPNAPYQITPSYTWRSAGMQQMLNAVRATGSTNVVLTSGLSYASAIYNWLEYKPTDPAGQLGAVWHAYSVPAYPTQVDCVNMPGCSATIMSSAIAIKAAGYPVVITEFGDQIGGSSAPWASVLLPFADTNGISYLGWAWDNWAGMSANVLITDAAGTPTQGYGTYVKAHYLCRAAGNTVCK